MPFNSRYYLVFSPSHVSHADRCAVCVFSCLFLYINALWLCNLNTEELNAGDDVVQSDCGSFHILQTSHKGQGDGLSYEQKDGLFLLQEQDDC